MENIQFCNGNELLGQLIDKKNLSIDEVAEVIGDSPLRLYRVCDGDEDLGKVAELTIMAVLNDLPPIEA